MHFVLLEGWLMKLALLEDFASLNHSCASCDNMIKINWARRCQLFVAVKCSHVLFLPLVQGESLALSERQRHRHSRDPLGWWEQGGYRWLWGPINLRQPSLDWGHTDFLRQPSPTVHVAGTPQRADAELQPHADNAAQPGGGGALCGR